MGLTPKQRRFVGEYLVDLNASAAARRAGYSVRAARGIGYENLTKPHIASAIQAAMRKRAVRVGVRADDVVRELARIGFATLGDVAAWDENGLTLRGSDDLSADQIATVRSVKCTKTSNGESDKVVVQIAQHDKLRALESLAKHLGLFKTRVELSGRSPKRARITELIIRGPSARTQNDGESNVGAPRALPQLR